DLTRDLSQADRDAPAMHRLEGERLQGEHLERTLEDLGAGRRIGAAHAPLDGLEVAKVSRWSLSRLAASPAGKTPRVIGRGFTAGRRSRRFCSDSGLKDRKTLDPTPPEFR